MEGLRSRCELPRVSLPNAKALSLAVLTDRTAGLSMYFSAFIDIARRVLTRPFCCRCSAAQLQNASCVPFSFFLAFAFCAFLTCGRVTAQLPIDLPPGQKLQPSENESESDSEKLRVKAFYLLDSAKNPVFIGDMSWDEYNDLKSGAKATSQLFVYKSLDIQGEAFENRADLLVSLEVTISPTDGKLISIPLQMTNFHVRGNTQFQPKLRSLESSNAEEPSNDEYYLELASDGKGYVLNARSRSGCELTVTMQMTARVESGVTQSMDFRLPDVPSRIEIIARGENLVGEIVGRGDEVIESSSPTKSMSLFRIESGGGRFMLRWGGRNRPTETPLLEVDSIVTMRWNSPLDQAIQSTQMEIRNLRGSVSEFELRLPVGATLLDTPQLVGTNQVVELTNERQTAGGTQWSVKIPEEEVGQEIDLSLDIQLARENTSINNPLAFRVPEVVGALREEGEIQIEISNDYRLRWTEHQYIQGVTDAVDGDTNTARKYVFRYDRSSFVLPLRMSATKRQLRASSKIDLQFHESTLELEMSISFNGQPAGDQGVRIDLAGWDYRSIYHSETGESLPWEREDDFLDVILQNNGNNAPLPIVMEARREIDRDNASVELRLPRVVKTDENLLVQDARLVLRSQGRSSIIVDLTKSDGLERVLPLDSDNASRTSLLDSNQFRLVPPEESARMFASVVERPPRITLASKAACVLKDQQIETIVNWTLTSQADLEGRLRISIPESLAKSDRKNGIEVGETATSPPSRLESTTNASVASNAVFDRWTVYVNDTLALLVPLENSDEAASESRMFELISPELSAGELDVRWRNVTPVAMNEDAFVREQIIHTITIPRPIVDDTTIRGDVEIDLVGNESHELFVADSSAQTKLSLQNFPREPVAISIVAKDSRNQQELTIRKAVVRTAIGELHRHEQVLAQTQGGNTLSVDLPSAETLARIEVFVDGQDGIYDRDEGQIHIALPDDQLTHTVDIRIWIENETPGVLEKVGPILSLPFGVQRSYWQVLTPKDKHVTWADPSMGRAMTWSFETWRLLRRPLQNDAALTSWVGGDQPVPMPEGNSYLYSGADSRAFRVRIAGRTVLWMWVSGIMIATSVMLTYVPQTRHPLTAIAAALAFTGLVIIAPDSAVLAGQLAMISTILVCVMLAIRSLMQPQPARVLTATRPPNVSEGSTRTLVRSSDGKPSDEKLSETKTAASPSESLNRAEPDAESALTSAKNAGHESSQLLPTGTRGSSVQSARSRGSTSQGASSEEIASNEITPGEFAP